jgi:hypothetical protein
VTDISFSSSTKFRLLSFLGHQFLRQQNSGAASNHRQPPQMMIRSRSGSLNSCTLSESSPLLGPWETYTPFLGPVIDIVPVSARHLHLKVGIISNLSLPCRPSEAHRNYISGTLESLTEIFDAVRCLSSVNLGSDIELSSSGTDRHDA